MPRALGAILEAATAILLALLAVNATFELVAWMLWQRSFAALDEIQALLMVWFGMLSASYCLARGLHLAVDVVASRLAPRMRRIVATVPPLAVAVFGGLLSIYGWRLVGILDNTLPGTGWSAALQYQPVAVAGLLIAGIGLWQLHARTVETGSHSGPDVA
ncbi:MAG: TRAP transporter small permease subunit [Acidobacteriota bacterium]|nr:TRAP transporter small permease subunit [Acidobacteriota bacterium]